LICAKMNPMKRIYLFPLLALVVLCCQPADKTWVAIGDSITYLNDHPDETGNRVTKGYLTGVVEKLPHIHYINKGYNGWTAGDIAWEIEVILPPDEVSSANIFTVFLGTNDWWRGRPLGSITDYDNNT